MTKDYTKMDISELKQVAFDCECGRHHSVNIDDVLADRGALNKLPQILAKYKNRKMLMVSDPNTHEACGRQVEEMLSGFNITSFVYKDRHIDANLHYTGRLLVELDPSYEFILGVGSGVINDICRTVSFRMGVPYAIVATAASMDGYASTISPTFIDGQKVSVPGTIAKVIAADMNVLENEPEIMLKAGFGDVLGKAIGRADWMLAAKLTGEHICPTCIGIVINAYDKCVENIGGIKESSPEAVKSVFEALVLSGMVISLYDDSRPASGSEHMFAHYWDIAAINDNRSHPLHGISVGVGTYVASLIYEMADDRIPEGIIYPKADEIKAMLDAVGIPHSPAELGLSADEFRGSILDAWKNKPERFTVLHLIRDLGIQDEIADKLVNLFY